MKNSARLIAFALCFDFFVLADQIPAADIEGITFQDKIIIENLEFQLRGVALLKYMLFFKAYVGALYASPNKNCRRNG